MIEYHTAVYTIWYNNMKSKIIKQQHMIHCRCTSPVSSLSTHRGLITVSLRWNVQQIRGGRHHHFIRPRPAVPHGSEPPNPIGVASHKQPWLMVLHQPPLCDVLWLLCFFGGSFGINVNAPEDYNGIASTVVVTTVAMTAIMTMHIWEWPIMTGDHNDTNTGTTMTWRTRRRWDVIHSSLEHKQFQWLPCAWLYYIAMMASLVTPMILSWVGK